MGFKIYTKTGDAGQTGLFGGERVSKDHIRIDAYGTVDELNSHLGLLRALLKTASLVELNQEEQLLERIQSALFTCGSQLATPSDKKLSLKPISADAVLQLEEAIDRLDDSLPPLTSFILPAGTQAAAQCHVCRTVARRAERCVVALNHLEQIDVVVIQYLNRLSDYLFTLARAAAHAEGEKDTPWVAER